MSYYERDRRSSLSSRTVSDNACYWVPVKDMLLIGSMTEVEMTILEGAGVEMIAAGSSYSAKLEGQIYTRRFSNKNGFNQGKNLLKEKSPGNEGKTW